LPIVIGVSSSPIPDRPHYRATTRGTTELENLALACIHCNRFKGPNIAGIDPGNGEIVRLFHPRRDSWTEHFAWNGPEVKELTQIGRVTIALLLINDPEVIALRKALQEEGVFGV
jgi:hypothetical protein